MLKTAKFMDNKIEGANMSKLDVVGGEGGTNRVKNEQKSNYSVKEIEEMYGEIEEERQHIKHILDIKDLLVNYENESEAEIIVSLQMLKLIVVTLEDLRVTNIEPTVSLLKRHRSKKVVREVQRVVEKFKMIKEEQIDKNVDLSGSTKGQDRPTILDEPVLFNLPMDEGLPIGYIPTLDFTTVFEDIDDDGNPIIAINHNYESEQFPGSQINPSTENNTELTGSASIKKRKDGMINEGKGDPIITEIKEELLLQEDSIPSPTKKRQKLARRESSEKWKNKMRNRPSDTEFSLRRFSKYSKQNDSNNDETTVKKDDEDKVHRKSNEAPRESQGTSIDDAKMDEKLETSKRKLHQGYQAHLRDRRSTRFFEGYDDIPRDESSRRTSCPRNSNRSWRY